MTSSATSETSQTWSSQGSKEQCLFRVKHSACMGWGHRQTADTPQKGSNSSMCYYLRNQVGPFPSPGKMYLADLQFQGNFRAFSEILSHKTEGFLPKPEWLLRDWNEVVFLDDTSQSRLEGVE